MIPDIRYADRRAERPPPPPAVRQPAPASGAVSSAYLRPIWGRVPGWPASRAENYRSPRYGAPAGSGPALFRRRRSPIHYRPGGPRDANKTPANRVPAGRPHRGAGRRGAEGRPRGRGAAAARSGASAGPPPEPASARRSPPASVCMPCTGGPVNCTAPPIVSDLSRDGRSRRPGHVTGAGARRPGHVTPPPCRAPAKLVLCELSIPLTGREPTR